MKAERFLPCALLQPFIRAFLVLDTEDGMLNRLLPDTSIVAAFRIRGKVGHAGGDFPGAMVSGLRRSMREVQYSQQSTTLLVQFKEGKAASFFRVPMHELFNTTAPLDQFFDRGEVARLEDQLAEAADHRQRVRLAEQFLLAQLQHVSTSPVVDAAIAQIVKHDGLLSISALASSLFLSQDAFEKKFRHHTGASPKRFAATVRFRKLVEQYTPGLSFTELAYRGGYFDQSHFIRDFRSFTGLAPHEFFKSSRYW